MLLDHLRKELPTLQIETISEGNLADVLTLFQSNIAYFSATQSHAPTLEECRTDMTALPPGRGLEHKSFMALYREKTCVAVVDFVTGYPGAESGYLGLLILWQDAQGAGLGTSILDGLFRAARKERLRTITLSCHESNYNGLDFWKSKGFQEIGRSQVETDGVIYPLLRMEKML